MCFYLYKDSLLQVMKEFWRKEKNCVRKKLNFEGGKRKNFLFGNFPPSVCFKEVSSFKEFDNE